MEDDLDMPCPTAKPMSIPEMLRRSAEMYEQGNDRDRVLSAIEHTLGEVKEELYRLRPGLEIDRILGTAKEAA